jgi:FAD/FMN-containing dehydrogenase
MNSIASTVFPNNTLYGDRERSYWAVNTRLAPACIVLPESPEQVSNVLKQLVSTKQQFAVRSGGHSPVLGTNDITNGVTVDLSHMKRVTFDASTETAHVQAGAQWGNVYEELTKYDRTVPGGRGGDVGVSGLLLGGGSTWWGAKNGWACDNVLSFEVALADGSIVNANRDTHSDLFRALKGGSNNFGIVTSFTMTTLPSTKVWGGIAASPESATSDVVDVMWDFTENAASYQDSYILTVLGYFPDFGANVASTAVFQGDGNLNVPEFEGWRQLPKIVDMTAQQTIHNLSFSITLPRDYHNAWFTLCIKNNKEIMNKAAEVHEQLVKEIQEYVTDSNFITNCIFQPLPEILVERSIAAGGNMLGLERNTGNAILFQLSAMMKTAEQAAWVHPKLKAAVETIKTFAASIEGGLNDFVYMNYADKSQDVLGGYGAENVEFMKRVAKEYDPHGVFQKLCPGGWKLTVDSL